MIDNGSGPATQEVLDRFAGPRLRVVRFDENIGLMPALRRPRRARRRRDHRAARRRRRVPARPPRADGRGARRASRRRRRPRRRDRDRRRRPRDGALDGAASSAAAQLLDMLFFGGNHVISPTAAVRREVYEACGGYEPSLPIAGDIDFWLRAATRFGFRHIAGGPVVRLRRHGGNYSDESQRARELEQVEQAHPPRAAGLPAPGPGGRTSTGTCCRRRSPSAAPASCWPSAFAARGLPGLAAELAEQAGPEPASRGARLPRPRSCSPRTASTTPAAARSSRASRAARWPPAAGT